MPLRDRAGQRCYVIMMACRGDGQQGTTRYLVRIDVPRRGGWHAWGTVRADFERALASLVGLAVLAAGIASEHRRGAGYARVTLALAVAAADVVGALAAAWDAFRDYRRRRPGRLGGDRRRGQGPARAAVTRRQRPQPHRSPPVNLQATASGPSRPRTRTR